MWPNFIVIGGARCGSTALCRKLAAHPDVFMTDPKEPFFFSHRKYETAEGRAWYASLFEPGAASMLRGEGSTSYSAYERAERSAARIAQEVPDCRLIYIVRHPLRRMESQWKLRAASDPAVMNMGFSRALREFPSLIDDCRYGEIEEMYLRHFPREQLLVVFQEEMEQTPELVLQACFRHLGIEFAPLMHETLAERVNPSRDLRVRPAWIRWVRKMKIGSAARMLLPRSMRRSLHAWLTRPTELVADWDPESLEMAREELKAASLKFLLAHGKPDDLWKFETRSPSLDDEMSAKLSPS